MRRSIARRITVTLIAVAGIVARPVAAQTVTPLDSLRIVDQSGRNFGRTSLTASGFFMKARDVYVRIIVERDRLVGSDNTLFFESEDCSGQPFMQVNPEAPAGYGPSHVGPAPEQTLRTPREGAPPATILVGSFSGGVQCQPRPQFGDITAVPVDPLLDLGPLYTPPFRVTEEPAPPASCCGDCDGNGTVAINELLNGVGSALDGCTAK